MSSGPSYREQLETVSSAFSEHLKTSLEQIEAIWRSFLSKGKFDKNVLQSLSDMAHELRGQGTLFGYPDVTQSAGSLEDVLEQVIHTHHRFSVQIEKSISSHIQVLKNASQDQANLRESLFIDNEAITAIFDFKTRAAKKSQPRKILIIDDADMMRRRIAISLTQVGFEVHEAQNGIAGIELAIQIIPDLILLDIKMPEVDGFEVQQTIRTHTELMHVPLIFLTSLGRVSVGQIQTALSFGVSDYISKPFNMEKLIKKVKDNLR